MHVTTEHFRVSSSNQKICDWSKKTIILVGPTIFSLSVGAIIGSHFANTDSMSVMSNAWRPLIPPSQVYIYNVQRTLCIIDFRVKSHSHWSESVRNTEQ